MDGQDVDIGHGGHKGWEVGVSCLEDNPSSRCTERCGIEVAGADERKRVLLRELGYGIRHLLVKEAVAVAYDQQD